jgi:hypothetical protein
MILGNRGIIEHRSRVRREFYAFGDYNLVRVKLIFQNLIYVCFRYQVGAVHAFGMLKDE